MARQLWACALLLTAVRAGGQEPVSPPIDDAPPLRAVWRNGPRLESDDGAYSLFVGGVFQFDVSNYLAPRGIRRAVAGDTGPLEDGVLFRRARLHAGGTLARTIDFFVQADLATSQVTDLGAGRARTTAAPTALWLTFREVPTVGNIRVGNQKPPVSLEHLTDGRFLTFMERSLAFDAFVEGFNNGYQPGVVAFDTFAGGRGTWAAGGFKTTRGVFAFNTTRNEHELDARGTYLPVWDDDGRRLVHVGVGGGYRDLDEAQQRLRARFDVRSTPSTFAPAVADTGLLFASRQGFLVPEFAVVNGPLSVQAEYYLNWLTDVFLPGPGGTRTSPQGNVFTHGGYIEAHYFLTGEHRPYDRATGTFGRVVPLRPLDYAGGRPAKGLGAWQTTARYSYLHLTDAGVRGGIVHDVTVGLNWFATANVRMQFNTFVAHRDGTGGDGLVYGTATRLAWDF